MVTLGGRSSRRRLLGEINVTPLVDVMLVLLIIFMVTVPLMEPEIDVQLPRGNTPKVSMDKHLVITVSRDERIYLNKRRLTLSELDLALRAFGKTDQPVYLRADERVPYGTVATIMVKVKAAGISKLGVVTEPGLGR
ncbi:MAG: biopolymer transporter ExbD [Candidatus Tectomicrobia bacterium]|uniref:Biopolymer transporter ExbD n=1 Tax=Tectimicrobiota bacterium TaxID=2528274 RepID=A0A932GQY8_UNCTE|nr:biopolymer transporter ExbD [Candidatus Tectomicrobia bacterium]